MRPDFLMIGLSYEKSVTVKNMTYKTFPDRFIIQSDKSG